jgi:nucleoside-diphosphate-sugar epimerase
MKRPRTLITGSRGRIGSILTNALSDSFDVYGVDVAGEPDERNQRVDTSDLAALESAFSSIGGIEYVVHLAADPRVEADWDSILKNNIIGTHNTYECARRHGVKRVVFASSNHATGAYEGLPRVLHKQANPRKISIADPVRPDGDYGTSKVFGEAVARQCYELYGLQSICLRIGSLLPDDDPTRDERSMRAWLSHRDLIQLVRKSLLSDVGFGIYYGVSRNKGMFWDISNAEEELGYEPQDDASRLK